MIKIGLCTDRYYSKEYAVYDNTAGEDYLQSIELAGALPIAIPLYLKDETLKEYIDLCDAFLIPGGIDVDPSFYNEEKEEKCGTTNKEYDNYQIKLIKMIMESGKPILGICRGLQILNVAFGGSLIQDIPSSIDNHLTHNQENERYETIHEVMIDEDSFLYPLLGNKAQVNSKHHQSIKEVGEGLKVVAESSDGVIEAIEGISYPLIAVQWHPENFIRAKENTMKSIFSYFVEMCDNKKEEVKL